jgi:hypothetical protein
MGRHGRRNYICEPRSRIRCAANGAPSARLARYVSGDQLLVQSRRGPSSFLWMRVDAGLTS